MILNLDVESMNHPEIPIEIRLIVFFGAILINLGFLVIIIGLIKIYRNKEGGVDRWIKPNEEMKTGKILR